MAMRGALIQLGAGSYAIPELGRPAVQFKAWQPLVHARLGALGPYYLGGLTALAEHRLTDISSKEVTAIIGFRNSTIEKGLISVGGRPVVASRSLRGAVFADENGIETVALSRTEAYRRSNVTRTLVDALWRPELFGATETWVTAWGRGERNALDVGLACKYAVAIGPSTAQRTGLLLDLLGHGQQAKQLIPKSVIRRGSAVRLVADSNDTEETVETDPYWRVAFNMRREQIEGWLTYGK
jgi:predicted transcriptional regulator of viral defense system